MIGWSQCGTDTFDNNPRAFYWAQNADGTFHSCHVFTGFRPQAEQYDYFRVSDTNWNSYWGAFFNGTELLPSGVNLDFTLGWSGAAMERGDQQDSGFARWTQLREHHAFANGWSDWDDADDANTEPDDRGYHCHAEDANTVRIHPGDEHNQC